MQQVSRWYQRCLHKQPPVERGSRYILGDSDYFTILLSCRHEWRKGNKHHTPVATLFKAKKYKTNKHDTPVAICFKPKQINKQTKHDTPVAICLKSKKYEQPIKTRHIRSHLAQPKKKNKHHIDTPVAIYPKPNKFKHTNNARHTRSYLAQTKKNKQTSHIRSHLAHPKKNKRTNTIHTHALWLCLPHAHGGAQTHRV